MTQPVANRAPHKLDRWYHPRSLYRSFALRPRIIFGAGVGFLALLLLPHGLGAPVREATAWSLGGLAYLLMAFSFMRRCHSDHIRQRAARQDDSAVVVLLLILLAMFSSFVAILGLLGEAKAASGEGKLVYVGLAGVTILVSWTVMQVSFTFHYAHEYYHPRHQPDADMPLGFPNDLRPDYWDFFYFATSFGAASQTSDVPIKSKSMRRLATLHAVVSFFFNTMVLALAINLAASLAS
jgi:uncharacterized membrane protein